MNTQQNFGFYFFLFLNLISYSLAFGQIESYPIADYLYPDIKRTAFSISPNFSYINSKNIDNNYSILSLDANIYRQQIINSRAKQCLNFTGLNIGYHNNNQWEIFNKLYLNFFLNIENRYFLKKKWYLEIETYSSIILNSPRYFLEDQNQRNLYNRISPKIGWGRIENVTDNWHALTILKQLKNKGLLSRRLNNGEVKSFAILLSQIKNYRNPDFRLERISELSALTEFFIEHEIIKEESIDFYAELQDAYTFEGFVIRAEGASFDIGPKHIYRQENIDLSTEELNTHHIYGIQLEYEKNKVKSTKLQFNQNYRFLIGFWNIKRRADSEFNKFTFHELELNLELGYYASRRTFFSIRPSIFYRNFHDNPSYLVSSGLNINAFYYVSPRLRYNVNGALSLYKFQNGNELIDDNNQTRLNFSMTYFFQ